VVTNQSGVARGFFDEAFVQRTHEFLQKRLHKSGVVVQAWYYCPHHPSVATVARYKKKCLCRKPQPGMLLQAAHDFGIDLSQSVMIGDKRSDLDAGKAAGCRSFDINALMVLPDDAWRKVLLSVPKQSKD